MNTEINQQPATIEAWLTTRGVTDVAEHHIARALGVQRGEVEPLLSAAPTVENLLNLNRLAQLRHLALAKRVWPNCTWLAWGARQAPYHPVIKLILDTFGYDLLKYVSRAFGEDIVLQYWRVLEVPPEYDDIPLDYDAPDPYAGLPFEQIVDNPHFDEDEGGEFHVFGCPETAACFLWLIESRYNFANYVGNVTGYSNDPMSIRLAYDMRRVLQREYWATLPPDTLINYLAIARNLRLATVPEEYYEGRLAPIRVNEVATLPTNVLNIVQIGGEEIWLCGLDTLRFEHQLIHVFALEPNNDDPPAGLILTTETDPGSPERHRSTPPLRYLYRGQETIQIGFVPLVQMEHITGNLNEAERVIDEVLWGRNCALHEESGIFCLWCCNPGSFARTGAGEPIPVYRIPGGYMIQFNPSYTFSPQEMAVD